MPQLNTDVRYIKGIGEQRAAALAKLGIRTLWDLLNYFPRAYDDRRTFRRIRDLVPGETACVEAMVAAEPTLSRIRRGLELVKLRAVDDSGVLDITFFNQAYMKNSLHPGETYTFFGKAEGDLLRRSMNNPVVEREGSRTVTHLSPHRRSEPEPAGESGGAGADRLSGAAGGPAAGGGPQGLRSLRRGLRLRADPLPHL